MVYKRPGHKRLGQKCPGHKHNSIKRPGHKRPLTLKTRATGCQYFLYALYIILPPLTSLL